ncbi:hypothetical protein AVEN_273160-1 [Araneus ventricosus]|uniref:Uncharacterized protein n=1 Tax=Araneus ventricosus TaxID=182803 RepID=A0A4Y2K2S7_ARAVE|nr:hypothetical protein AVEN_273160-1 [Araneus ventricosus]
MYSKHGTRGRGGLVKGGIAETSKQNKQKRGAEVKIPTLGCGVKGEKEKNPSNSEGGGRTRRGKGGERVVGEAQPAGVDVPRSWNIHEQDALQCRLPAVHTRPYIRAYFVTDAPAGIHSFPERGGTIGEMSGWNPIFGDKTQDGLILPRVLRFLK